MFKIKIFGISIGVSFSFFAVTALIFLCGKSLYSSIITALFCCFLHEIGHIVFMLLFSRKPKEIVLYGGGIRISPNTDRLIHKWQDIVILLAGCIFNFVSAGFAFACFGMCFLCEVNIMLGAFNLLPFQYFDGGRVLKILLDDSKAYDFIRAFFIFLIAVCIIMMNLNGIISISFMLTFFFIAISEIIY